MDLYGVQQELGRLQACLEGRHDTNTHAVTQRRQAQEQLDGVRGQYSGMVCQVGKQRTHGERTFPPPTHTPTPHRRAHSDEVVDRVHLAV